MKIHKARRLRPEQKQRHIHTAAILHFLCPQGNLNVYYIQFLFVLIQYYHYYYSYSHCPLEFLIKSSIAIKIIRPTLFQ